MATIGVKDLLSRLMRQGQFGNIATLGNPGDQPTLDLIASLNSRLAPIWGEADWKWARESIRFALAPNVRQYTVATVSGNKIDRIQLLVPYDVTGAFLQGDPLNGRTELDFYTYCTMPKWDANSGGGSSNWNTGAPEDYYIVNLDANGNWTIIIDPVPVIASFMGGFAKALLPTYAIADVVANTVISYFPNGVVNDALFQGMMIDVGLLKGMTIENAAGLENAFQAKIRRMVKQQIGVTTDNSPRTTRLPKVVSRSGVSRRGFGW